MTPAEAGIIGGILITAAGKIIDLLVARYNSSTFTDKQREFIDLRIMHKLSNERIVSDAKYVHKKEPRL